MRSLFVLLFFFSMPAWSLPWTTNFHHIEPVMNEATQALEESSSLTCDKNATPVLSYISARPKTEDWRNYYKIPKLLTADFYKVKDVCEEAKRMNKAQGVVKKYALVANKTHLCDTMARSCISTLKSISDPCNNFIQDNFQVFHSRSYIGHHKTKGHQQILDEYGSMGPSLLVIDLESCELMPTINAQKVLAKGMGPKEAAKESHYYTPPSLDGGKDEKGEYLFRSEDERVRFSAMKEALISHIPGLKNLESKKVDCFQDGKRTLPGISDKEEVPYGDIKVKGIVGIRKLMDEQYIESSGINPYDK